MRRKIRALAAALLLSVTLSGCGGFHIVFNPEELYALPELPAKYTELNAQLNAILEDGAEYAAPASGTNIQPVQLMDLNGDGQQEALAFFRKTEDEKPLKIYIFSARGDSYEQSAVIEGSGASVYSVVYSDLDGDGRTELIVGWRASGAVGLRAEPWRHAGASAQRQLCPLRQRGPGRRRSSGAGGPPFRRGGRGRGRLL